MDGRAWALIAVLSLPGCGRQLMPTPNLYVGAETDPFAGVAPALQTSDVEVLYATDRVPGRKHGSLRYGHERSPSRAFGDCVIRIGRGVSWEELVHNSRVSRRDVALPLSIASITELGRFPDAPPLVPEARDHARRVEAAFLEELGRRLALTPRKEAFVFVHGYHDSFEMAAFVAAELWHFLGREGVPILYTWPAGHGGVIQGYDYDQDSGFFSVHHLKGFLELLASCPDLEAVSIIAHSRGTVVATDALRELFIAARAAGRESRKAYRLNNVVLAAADIDLMVATQRLFAEHIGTDPARTTVYVSEHDRALGVSSWLFADRRLGQLEYKDLTEYERSILTASPRLDIVDARVPTKGWGHSYFHTSPAVSSDLILVLRENRDPGAAHGRPLTDVGPNFWDLGKGYPNEKPQGN